MSLTLLRFLAMTIGPSITAAARPATTFLTVQITIFALVYNEIVVVPELLTWLISPPAIIVAAIFAALETAAKHDSDVASILQDLQIDRIAGVCGAFTSALLFAALGMPEAEAMGLVDGSHLLDESSGVLGAAANAAATDHSNVVRGGAVAAAVTINLTLTHLRGRILLYIRDFKISRIWAWLETGGVVALLILLPLLPLITAAFMLLAVLAMASMALAGRATAGALDQRSRTDCKSCGYALRAEASLCPECKTGREPTARPTSGVGAAWAMLRSKE